MGGCSTRGHVAGMNDSLSLSLSLSLALSGLYNI